MKTKHYFVNMWCAKCLQKSAYIPLFFIMGYSSLANSQSDWRVYKNKEGIDVQYKEHQSGAVEVKGKVTVKDATTTAFLTLLSDTKSAPNWLENITQVKLLTFLSDSENLVHTFIDSPWPVSNRDVVTYACYQQISQNKSVLNITAKPNYLPENPKIIRIKTLDVKWYLTQHDDSLTILYQVYTLPEGSIPLWLSNKIGIKSVAKTLTNLREQLQSKKYASTARIIKAGTCDNLNFGNKSDCPKLRLLEVFNILQTRHLQVMNVQ
jgi:hypothetical protein